MNGLEGSFDKRGVKEKGPAQVWRMSRHMLNPEVAWDEAARTGEPVARVVSEMRGRGYARVVRGPLTPRQELVQQNGHVHDEDMLEVEKVVGVGEGD